MLGTGNRLLQILSPASRAVLMLSAREIDLPIRSSLFHMSHSPAFVHFLTSGAASVVVTMQEGGSAEVGMIGDEGIVGATALLGSAPMESECFMQIAGAGLRIPLKTMRTAFDNVPEIRMRVLEFLQSQMNISAQLSACNKLHEAEARLARWLLMTSDRIHSDMLNLTQEFLAEMLGSQRTTVALVAGILQRAGHIEYSRGRVRILDRAGLSAVACDCYEVTCKIVEKLYTGPEHGHTVDGLLPNLQSV